MVSPLCTVNEPTFGKLELYIGMAVSHVNGGHCAIRCIWFSCAYRVQLAHGHVVICLARRTFTTQAPTVSVPNSQDIIQNCVQIDWRDIRDVHDSVIDKQLMMWEGGQVRFAWWQGM